MNAGLIQDLYHYSLAILGEPNGLDANTLIRRLEKGQSAYDALTTLENIDVANRFSQVIPYPEKWTTELEMKAAGQVLKDAVQEYALFCMVEPYSGEEITNLR